MTGREGRHKQPYELVTTAEGVIARISARGSAVLSSPTVNRGTAFTEEERRALGLTGLLPSEVSTLRGQVARVYAQYRDQDGQLQKWVYLATLRDRNEVLFYRLLCEHIAEMLPIIYTPTVGLAIERFSHEFRRARRGIYLSVEHPEDIEASLRNSGLGPGDVDLIVATDSEGILGIGDQGVGGIEIAIGKLAVYTAAAGIHPHRVMPVVLDTGTDNPALLDDEMYLGLRHPRVRDQRYDDFIDAYVRAASKIYPDAMLHWEDFGAGNARRILNRYAEQVCTFNDDMQGTAAVVLAAAFAAVRTAGTTISQQRVVIHGSGTAGLGIADMMREVMIREGVSPEEATGRFFALGSRGLLVDDDTRLRDFQVPYARKAAEVADWAREDTGRIGLAEVVCRVRPTMLIGTSAQAGAFSEEIITRMGAHVERPIVMPLSNPTSKCEGLPQDIVRWTGGRALIATGSPFPPVTHNGHTINIAQANNALVFPGLGLGVTVARARRITESMIMAAAEAVAEVAGDCTPGAPLLPAIEELRPVSEAVAVAVALEAEREGLARVPLPDPHRQVRDAMWEPEYPRLEID